MRLKLLALALGLSVLAGPMLGAVAHANPPQGPRISKPAARKLITAFLKQRWATQEKAEFGPYPGYKVTLAWTAANAASWKFWDDHSFEASPKGFRGDFAKGPYALNGTVVTSKVVNGPQGVMRVSEHSYTGFGDGSGGRSHVHF